MKDFFSFCWHVVEDLFSLIFIPLILLALFAGGFAAAHFADMRQPDTPHFEFRVPFIYKFAWTAPPSPYAQGLALGRRQGAAAQWKQDSGNLGACLKREADRAQQDQDAALERARAVLRAQQAARGGRERLRAVVQSVDRFQGTGGACNQAEQMIREFVK